jgi:hypothetical protein
VLELEDPKDLPVDLDMSAVLELICGDHGSGRPLAAPRKTLAQEEASAM